MSRNNHLPTPPRRTRSASAPSTAPTPIGAPDSSPLSTLVASARRITGRTVARSSAQAWQDEAWAMYDEVGELRFVANSVAAAASRGRIFAATVTAGADHPDPVRTDDNALADDDPPTDDDLLAAEVVGMLARNVLGRSEMLRRVVLHLFVPGDGYLVGVAPGVLDTRGPGDQPTVDLDAIEPEGEFPLEALEWHALSVAEVSMRAGKVELNVGDGSPVALDEDECVVVRLWRPHPRKWWQADSPVRANLPVLRELVGLTKHVSASIDSRLAGAGMLVLPNSVEVVGGGAEQAGDTEPPPGFVDALIDAMVTPLEERDSAAALVPLVIRVPDEAVDKVQHIRFDTPLDEHAKDLRDEAIRRLALGLDAPPEVLLGLGETNHWSAWQIDEATAKLHIEPLLALICDALTTQYLWPTLEAAGVGDVRRYVVWFDAHDLTQRPNRTAEATEGHARGLLSDEAWRRYSGFDETDAPEVVPVDDAVELAIELVARAPSLMANPGLPAIVEQIRVAASGNAPAEDLAVDETVGTDDGGPGSGRDIPEQDDAPPAVAASAEVARLRRMMTAAR